jgi:adenylosuccinate lyase
VIGRYTRQETARIWSEEAKYAAWLRVEAAVCEAYHRRGLIPTDVMTQIRAWKIDVARILQIQHRVKHEMVSVLTLLEEQLGTASRFVHIGLTSSDIADTALALQLRDAADLLIAGQDRLQRTLGALVLRHKDTLVAAAIHSVHAEPVNFGLKVAAWDEEARRNLSRLRRARAAVAVGKLSGAVGTFAYVEPQFEEEVCRELGLAVELVATQIVQRDIHAEFCAMLALAGASLERIVLEVRELQYADVLQLPDVLGEEQRVSDIGFYDLRAESTDCVSGLARLLRTNAHAAVENVALWHERDISHSSVERVILPDSTILFDYLLDVTTSLIERLAVAGFAKNLGEGAPTVY